MTSDFQINDLNPPAVDELRPIPGYEDLYAITQDGRVWSHPKNQKHVRRKHDGRWLKVSKNGTVPLSNAGQVKAVSVRTVVRKVWADVLNVV